MNRLKQPRRQKPTSAGSLELRPWFRTYRSTELLLELVRDEIARLPKRDKLRVLTQLDTLREDVAEMVKASS